MNKELKKPKGEKELLEETSYLEKLARETPETSVRANSYLRLAYLYVDSRNPQLNYSRALQGMEYYLAVSTAKASKDGFQDWVAVLREVDYLSKSKTEMEKKNQSLRAQNDKLQAAMEKLQKMIQKKEMVSDPRMEQEMFQLNESFKNMGESVENMLTIMERMYKRLGQAETTE